MYCKKIFITLLLFTVCLFGATKRYDIKSGIVEYTITGQGETMGVTSSIKGSAKLIFKEYGLVEVEKETLTEHVMGQTQTMQEFSKYEDGLVYSVDYEEKLIYKQDVSKLDNSQTAALMGESGLKSIGAKKVGTETILKVSCDVWKLDDMKLCLYKGIPLKIETNMMGYSQTQIAKKVNFNIAIDDNEFLLPNYPIKTMDSVKSEFQKEMENMTPEEKKMMEQMMQKMKMFNNQ
ncbi:hypothetical protein ACMC56_00725 [Campylobacterota bacterium DY0563]